MSGPDRASFEFTTPLYAHSLEKRPKQEWQPLADHLFQVARLAAQFAEAFDSQDWAWNAGLLHDLGKAHSAFQAYLMRENGLDDSEYDVDGKGRINHSSAGAALAETHWEGPLKPFGRIFAYLSAGHHAGLPDYYNGEGSLPKRLEDGQAHLSKIDDAARVISAELRTLPPPPKRKPESLHCWMRMLFSCLVDADFLDTEAFMSPERAEMRPGEGAPLKELKAKLDEHMAELGASCEATPVNAVRREILGACRASANGPQGLFSLSVPTGGGKTLAAMSFALDHALAHGLSRVIYVIPYTSIIEQTAAVLGRIFGEENVLEHHSNLDPDRETQRSRLAAENWDAPIVVTTNVQFFESLYAARTSRCRKLHNIAGSVVILDEAQMLPPNLLAPCVAALNELSKNYGATVLLSTATQPALPCLSAVREIVPGGLDLYKRLCRTVTVMPKDPGRRQTWEEIANELSGCERALCVVNTRRDCLELFRLMPEGTVHLSALMCGEHRSRMIAQIKECLKKRDSGPVRVVSTQLVEAGVDLDFPVVYRAMAGLDSIAQAAGRCNREGNLPGLGRVVAFIPPKGAPRGLLSKGENTTLRLLSLDGFDAQSPEWFTRYFECFYGDLNDTGHGVIRDLTPDDIATLPIAFRSTAEAFKLIDGRDSAPVFVRYAAGAGLIEQLRHGPERLLLRRLQRYTVNLPRRVALRMKDAGLLEEVWPGFLAQSDFNIYSEETGLDIERDSIPDEDLIGV